MVEDRETGHDATAGPLSSKADRPRAEGGDGAADPKPVAAVTGGNRGIGRAVVEALIERGYAVVSGSRKGRPRSEGDPDHLVETELDVRSTVSCGTFVQTAIDEFGRLDVLVNNAGVGVFGHVSDLSVEDWQLQIETNLTGAFLCTKFALPHLIERKGWVINIGSLASRHPFKGGTAYNASKFGLLGFSEALMLDVRQQGVRVSTIMPGSVDTEFFGREPGREDWRLSAQDVASSVVHLLDYPEQAHVSRVELRPSRPPAK